MTTASTSHIKRYKPYFSPQDIERLSAKQRGKLSVSREERGRQQACSFIDAVGTRCGLWVCSIRGSADKQSSEDDSNSSDALYAFPLILPLPRLQIHGEFSIDFQARCGSTDGHLLLPSRDSAVLFSTGSLTIMSLRLIETSRHS